MTRIRLLVVLFFFLILFNALSHTNPRSLCSLSSQIHFPGIPCTQLHPPFNTLIKPRSRGQRRRESRAHGQRRLASQGLLPPALSASMPRGSSSSSSNSSSSVCIGDDKFSFLLLLLFLLLQGLMLRHHWAFVFPLSFSFALLVFFIVTGLISGFLDRSNVLQVQIFGLAR